MHIRSLKVLALVALPLLLSSCQSLEQRGLAARESGDYRNAAEFYFGALRKGSTVENNSGYTASIGQYLEQLRSEREAISGSAGLDSYEGHTAPQLEDWMSRLSAMDVELDRIAAQVATARDLPAKKASPETLAAVSDGYGKLLASITALRDQARADGERLGVTIRSLKDFIETETAGAVRLSDSEDYEGMISLLERISVYRLGIERIEQMQTLPAARGRQRPALTRGIPRAPSASTARRTATSTFPSSMRSFRGSPAGSRNSSTTRGTRSSPHPERATSGSCLRPGHPSGPAFPTTLHTATPPSASARRKRSSPRPISPARVISRPSGNGEMRRSSATPPSRSRREAKRSGTSPT